MEIKKPSVLMMVVMLVLCFFSNPAPASAQVKLSEKAFNRLGQGIHLFIDRFVEAAAYIGKGNFIGKVSAPSFCKDFRKMQIQVSGTQKMPAGLIRHPVIRFFYVETPLPARSEYVGFF